PLPTPHSFPTRRSSDLSSNCCLFLSFNTVGVNFQHFQRMPHFILTGQIRSASVCVELTMSGVSKDDETSEDRKYNLENNNRYKVDRKSTRLSSSHDSTS